MKLAIVFVALFACIAPAQSSTLYLVDSNTDQLFSVDPATGAATLIGSTAPGMGTPAGMAFDGTNLYAIDLAGGGLSTLDVTTGTPTLLGTSGIGGWQDLAFDVANNRFIGVNQDDMIYSIDFVGNATVLGPTPAQFLLTAIAFDSSGTLWIVDFFGSGELGTYDLNTLSYTQVAAATMAGFQGMSFDPATGVLYGTDTNTDSLYTIDTTTGAVTLVGAHGAGVVFAKGMTFAGAAVPSSTVVGVGCAGVNGVTAIAANSFPALGNALFGIDLTGGAPNSGAALFAGTFLAASPTPLGSGCDLYLDIADLLAVSAAGFGPFLTTTDGTGAASFPLPVPADPSLAGVRIHFQGAVNDGTVIPGFTTSNALTLLLN